MRENLRRPGLTPAQRLEAFVLEKLRFTISQISDQPRIHELVTYIHKERRDIVFRHLEVQYSLLSEILAEGNRSGDFDLPDVVTTARLVHAAILKFHDPSCINDYFKEDLEEEAKAVVGLLIKGLRKQ